MLSESFKKLLLSLYYFGKVCRRGAGNLVVSLDPSLKRPIQ